MSVKRLDTPEGRYYIHVVKQGKSYEEGGFILMPSVTTILSLKVSHRLQELENEIGKEELEKIGQKASRKGTSMHRFLENYFICLRHGGNHENCLLYTQKKTPDDLKKESLEDDSISAGRNLFYNYIHEGYLDRIRKVLFTERFTWSLIHKFAGTADFVFINQDGRIVIADFKSANKIKDDETIHKYQLQLAAYTIAFEEIYKKRVDHAELWISHPLGIQDVSLSGELMEERKKEFIELSQEYHKNWNPGEIVKRYYKAA
jgi:CRISPR/Cas system-associated exonuclease Cas4 (RecB family)